MTVENTNGSQHFAIELDLDKLKRQAEEAKGALKSIGDSAVRDGSRIDEMLDSLKRTAADVFTVTAATTPFGLQDVANGAKQLLAYGLEAEKVNGTLVRLGDIAAGLSIPLGDLVYLYGTTMAQGRLYTQDLNQFTGRGIPMIAELAKQFGVAESEVKGLAEAGKVGFPEVQKAIESLMRAASSAA